MKKTVTIHVMQMKMTFWGEMFEKRTISCAIFTARRWEGALPDTHTESQRGCCRALSTSVIERMLPKIPWDDEFRYNSTPSTCPNTGSYNLGSRETRNVQGVPRPAEIPAGIQPLEFVFLTWGLVKKAVSKRASGRTHPACILEFWLPQIDCEVSSQRGELYKELSPGNMRLLRGMKAELGRGSCGL